MQYLEISRNTTLASLIDTVGSRNVDSILHLNELNRVPNVGQSLINSLGNTLVNTPDPISWQRKSTILNKFAGDLDLFEMASGLGSEGWKLLSSRDTFPNMLKIPDTVRLPGSNQVYGNGVRVPNTVYNKAMEQLASESTGHNIDSSVFNEYSAIKSSNINDNMFSTASEGDPFQWFHIPWGEITIYSRLSGDSKDIPVYPEELTDRVVANYTTMPDIIYQYEPWQIYQSSGPRSNTYTFHFHRDMWTGDHRDDGANQLIRFCQASCYPKYNGSAVNTDIVTLYVKGKNLITGVLSEVQTDWAGPIGLDGWYLECTMMLTITEVSQQALNYDVIRSKPIIG